MARNDLTDGLTTTLSDVSDHTPVRRADRSDGRCLETDDAAAQRDGDGFRSIAGAQLRQNGEDVHCGRARALRWWSGNVLGGRGSELGGNAHARQSFRDASRPRRG
jgi:hypothetical protein